MLLELKVSNFAVIDSLQVYFLRPGLNVLTGETGAGKSILIKSLGLLLGGKGTPDAVRAGHDQAVIEGAFDLSRRPDILSELKELSLDSGDDTLVVRRIISQSGKHRIYINGSLSTLNVLEKITPRLVEITGQHEHHSLTKVSAQLEVVDTFANLSELRLKFLAAFEKRRELKEEIENLGNSLRNREQRLDFLKYQIAEIENFAPALGEDIELNSKYQRAKFANKLHSFAQKAEHLLYSQENSVSSRISDLTREGEGLLELDPKLRTAVQSLKEAAVLVEDAAFGFRDYSKGDGPDDQELERLEDRISNLKKLQKKYGAGVEEILSFKEKAQTEVSSLEATDENLKLLEEELQTTEKLLSKFAEELHDRRTKAAKKLAAGINEEIHALNMKGTGFFIQVRRAEHFNSTGGDEVFFLISSSPKDEPRPISKVASGGELSRLMLAIKQVVSIGGRSLNDKDCGDRPMTYLFDEVDTGISGPTAEKVGSKLKSIGTEHQVVCITHLPQVASFADAHFLITKEIFAGKVKSEIKELSEKDRIHELGRMISGEKITTSSLAHAREMVEQHRRSKKKSKTLKSKPLGPSVDSHR